MKTFYNPNYSLEIVCDYLEEAFHRNLGSTIVDQSFMTPNEKLNR